MVRWTHDMPIPKARHSPKEDKPELFILLGRLLDNDPDPRTRDNET